MSPADIDHADLDIDTARVVLAGQPFNTMIGADLTGFGDGSAELVLTIEPRHRQQYGVVHGGVLAYLADNVVTFAAATRLGSQVLTSGVDVSYLRAARAGTLRAIGTVVRHTDALAIGRVEIWNDRPDAPDPLLCAIAQGTVVASPARTRR